MTAVDDLAVLEAGLDALEAHQVTRRSRAARAWSAAWPPALLVGLLVAVWQLLFSFEVVAHHDLPSPSRTLAALQGQWSSGVLSGAVVTSVRRAAVGFAVSLVVGTAVGLAVGRVRALRRALHPLLSVLQSLPSVAWVPAAVLWFGPSEATVYVVIVFGAVPSVANGVVSGLDQVPPLMVRVGQVLGARGLSLARHVLLPAALPGFLVGVRQGWSFSWRSLMAVELLVHARSLGVGNVLDASHRRGDVAGVLAGVLVILVIGVVVELGAFAPLERRVLRRRGLLADTL